MVQITEQDQLMLELINAARANPQAEANRLLNGDLNKDLSPGTISNTEKQPLAFNLELFEAARDHSQWMLNTNTFSHTGVNGSQPWDRAGDAGYTWSRVGENIAWEGTTGTLDFNASVINNADGLFESAGHRTNILNDSYREIGISNLSGDFNGYNAAITTQLFGSDQSNNAFLTGVVYSDAVTDDDFYSIGEGLGGITIKIEGNGKTFSTTTLATGGYQLRLAPGDYSVIFEGDFDGNGTTDQSTAQTVTVSDQNVKVDFATDTWQPSDNTAGEVKANSTTNNVITGTSAGETLTGTGQADTILGLKGADRLKGGGNDDILIGGEQNDVLLGGSGNDHLTGVDPSELNPGANEKDTLVGHGGSDHFILGNIDGAFYVESQGTEGRALIKDFNRLLDTIQLYGSADNYRLAQKSNKTNIFYSESGTPGELIGVIKGDFSNLSLTSDYFSYV